MKKLLFILLFAVSGFINSQEVTYINTPKSYYASPRIFQRCGDTLIEELIITDSWKTLYSNPNYSTHKLSGVEAIGGNNSVRAGVRRAANDDGGLILCPYFHINGRKNFMNKAFKDSLNHNMIMKYDSVYLMKYYSNKTGEVMEVYRSGKKVCWIQTETHIPKDNRWISNIYVEPKYFMLFTRMTIIKD